MSYLGDLKESWTMTHGMNKQDLKAKLQEYIASITFQEKGLRTIKKYNHDISQFVEFLEDEEPIKKQDVINYKQKLCDHNYKTSSINNYITIINTFLSWCQLSDYRVKEIKTQQKSSLVNVVSESDYHRLLRFARKLQKEEVYLIMKIIYTNGIRISELEAFTVENIKDFYFTTYNKGKEREIILTQELARELRQYCKIHSIKSGKIFQLSYSTIWRQMKQLAGAARVNKARVYPHSFRHLFAKAFMNQYNNVLDLADILGHSSLETTRIYTRSTLEEKRRKLENMKGRNQHGK